MNYPIDAFELQVDTSRVGLAVINKTTNVEVHFAPFKDAPLQLEVVTSAYVIREDVEASGFVQGLNPNQTAISVTASTLSGIGTIHIRDMESVAQQVDYHLGECAIFLRHIPQTTFSIEVLSPCSGTDCTTTPANCRTVIE